MLEKRRTHDIVLHMDGICSFNQCEGWLGLGCSKDSSAATICHTAADCCSLHHKHYATHNPKIRSKQSHSCMKQKPISIRLTHHHSPNTSTVQHTNTAQLAHPKCAHVCTGGKAVSASLALFCASWLEWHGV